MRETPLVAILERLRTKGSDDADFEAKKCAGGLSKDVWESVSAFANTSGGTLLLGVSEEDGFAPVSGFQANSVCDQFVTGMGDGGTIGLLVNPPEYQINRVICGDAVVLAIHIDELDVSQKPCYIRDRGVQSGSYKRIDDKDVRLSASELYSIQMASVVDASDREPVEGATASDLDKSLCEAVFARALVLAPRAMRGADGMEERLKRLNFTDSEGNVIRAGLLVAGVYPQQFFPRLVVDVAVHVGVTKAAAGDVRFRDRAVCEGTLGEMIEDAARAVAKNLRRSSTVSGMGRRDELELPEVVLREAITNAVVHRSYSARFDGEAVSVDVYDDRVEITNPGGLWGKSWDDLADGRSCCRNATLMRLMSLVTLPSGAGAPAEGNGTGILLMMREMAERGLRPPEFRRALDHFKVVLWRPNEEGGRTEAVRRGAAAVERVLAERGEMSIAEIVRDSGLSLSQARRRVNDLIAEGRVEATAPPTSRKRKYRLV